MIHTKVVTLSFLVWMFIACNSQNKKQVSSNNNEDTLDLVQSKAHSIKIGNEQWQGDSLLMPIEGESTEGGELVAYFDLPGKIVKLKASLYGETGRWIEYHFLDTAGKLYYLELEKISYNKPLYSEDNQPFIEKRSADYAIAFQNNKITEYAKFEGKRKFENEKNSMEEGTYWITRAERFRAAISKNSREMFQERYLQTQYDITKTKAMFCMKYGNDLFSFLNLTEDIDEKNRLTAEHPQFAVVKLEWQPKQFEWIKTNQAILVQSCDKIEVKDNYTITEHKGKTTLFITYIITNGKNKERHKKWIDPVDLSSDVEITEL